MSAAPAGAIMNFATLFRRRRAAPNRQKRFQEPFLAPAFAPVDPDDIDVAGRVIWVGRRL